jgi:hypothetical protein
MSLSDEQAETIMRLRDEEGMGIAEIALAMGVSYWSVQTLISNQPSPCDLHLADLRREYAQLPVSEPTERPHFLRPSVPSMSYVGSPALACARG